MKQIPLLGKELRFVCVSEVMMEVCKSHAKDDPNVLSPACFVFRPQSEMSRLVCHCRRCFCPRRTPTPQKNGIWICCGVGLALLFSAPGCADLTWEFWWKRMSLRKTETEPPRQVIPVMCTHLCARFSPWANVWAEYFKAMHQEDLNEDA